MEKRNRALLLIGLNLVAVGAALLLAMIARRKDGRLHYIEPGMPEDDEDVDPAALLTDVGESITPERGA